MDNSICAVCNLGVKSAGHPGDRYDYDCPRCGKFSLTGTARDLLPSRLGPSLHKRSFLSYLVRKMQESQEWPLLHIEVIDNLLESRSLPKPAEQARNLLLWLGNHLPSSAEPISANTTELQPIIGAIDDRGVAYILQHLQNRKFINFRVPDNSKSTVHIGLSYEGWEEFERIRTTTNESKIAFMAMQFNDPELDRVVNEIFRPAVAATGFELRVLTDNPRAGLIDDRLRVEIRQARLLIADVTHRNPGAYWEAGFAEGLGKPVIYTCKKGEFAKVVHFDTNHHLTVMWDTANLAATEEDLKATIRATLPEEAQMND